jgi:hypothetical protein
MLVLPFVVMMPPATTATAKELVSEGCKRRGNVDPLVAIRDPDTELTKYVLLALTELGTNENVRILQRLGSCRIRFGR